MSRYSNLKSSNPFEDDDEDGPNDFGGDNKNDTVKKTQHTTSISQQSHSSQSYSRLGPSSSNGFNLPKNKYQSQSSYQQFSSEAHYNDEENSPFEDHRKNLMMKIDNSENTQLESTQRALASLYESEAMGVATAEELIRQGETLNNIETKTSAMQQTLTTSQKHLNNIKSVFGGIKNWWGKDKKPQTDTKAPDASTARLKATIRQSNLPTKTDVSGFYEEDDDLDSRFMAGARNHNGVGGGYQVISPVTRSAREEEIDGNLAMMSEGMSRLKGLASGLGDEIERQNDQIDRIDTKVNRTDDLLIHQNTQMKKILRK